MDTRDLFSYYLIFSLYIISVSMAITSPGVALLRHLLSPNTYDRRTLPVENVTDPVDIYISVEINRINHLDDKNEVFSWVGYVNVTWNNYFLRWDPDEWEGITYLLMKEKDMWVPDVSILERIDDDVGFSDQKRRLITVTNKGDITWLLGSGKIDTPCKLDMYKFPFDEQVCGMSIGPYSMTRREVQVHHSNTTYIKQRLGKNGMWTVTNYTVEMKTMEYSSNIGVTMYDYVHLKIRLQRRPGYFVINIILPCAFISVLMCVVFLVPPNGGEKIAFSITLLVAFNVIQLVIIDMMPVTSESIPIIAVYVTTLLALSAMVIPLEVFVIDIYNNGDRHLPTCLRNFIFNTATNQNKKDSHLVPVFEPEIVDSSDENTIHTAANTIHTMDNIRSKEAMILDDIRSELCRLRKQRERSVREAEEHIIWQKAAVRMDRTFLMIFAPIVLVHTLICLGVMTS